MCLWVYSFTSEKWSSVAPIEDSTYPDDRYAHSAIAIQGTASDYSISDVTKTWKSFYFTSSL